MFNISFSIRNPHPDETFESIFERSGLITNLITNNVAWEAQIYKCGYTFVEFCIKHTTNSDHAGFTLTVGVIGYTFEFMTYDTRHWDYKNNCWENSDN